MKTQKNNKVSVELYFKTTQKRGPVVVSDTTGVG